MKDKAKISFGKKIVELFTLGKKVSVQNPLPTDGDSVYEKDIWVEESIYTDWNDLDNTGISPILIPFTNLHTRIINNTTDNPKILMVHFNRTISLDQVGIGSVGGGNFSNAKIVLLGSGEVPRTVLDDSSNNIKYTSKNYQFGAELGNALRIEFYTADEVTISNITVQKVTKTASRLQALTPDGTVINIDATTGGNLKISLEEFDETFYSTPLPVGDFYLLVQKGLIPGHSLINKFGQNPSLNSSTYEDIWDVGGNYIYPVDGTAPIVKIDSDNSGDTEPIEVQGLDINGDLVVQTKTLTGTTPVILDTPLWRIFRMKNVGTTDILGKVHAIDALGATIYAQIDNGNNQTLMALYTIPNGKTGYLLHGTNNLSGITRAVASSGKLMMRPHGKVFQLKKTFGVNSEGSSYISVKNFRGAIPAKTDIKVSAIGSANGVSLNTTFDILLVDD